MVGVDSNKVAVHLLAKISNVISFYKAFLAEDDKEFVSFKSIAKSLNEACQVAVKEVLGSKTLDKIASTQTTAELQDALIKTISEVYSFIDIANVVRITADSNELDELSAMKAELYIDEEKLKIIQKRNNFLNRFTDESNAHLLQEAKTKADFTAAMDKIDQQNLLNQDEKARFASTLFAQRQIREAKNDDEVQTAMLELKKAGILRDSELEDFATQISQNKKLRDLNDTQAITLLTLQNERVIDTEKLAWEIEIGNKRIENQLERQRLMDEYNDSRREKDAAFEDSRRRAQIDLDMEEQKGQLELLRQAQAIRQEREDAEHRREMDKIEAQRIAHKDDLDADLEKNRIYAGMSAEQIMAANPNIAPAAAAALAAKFSNDNAVEAQKQINEAQKESNAQMMGMMQQFMNQMQADKNADREQQLKFMEMMSNQNNIQMQQMSAMASNIAMGKSQEANARMQEKDAEIGRINQSSENHQDRMLDAMKTTVNAVAGTTAAKKSGVCPNCGAKIESGESFCGECGTSV